MKRPAGLLLSLVAVALLSTVLVLASRSNPEWSGQRQVPVPGSGSERRGTLPGDEPPPKSAQQIQLVAVQLKWSLDDYQTPEGFARRIDGVMAKVAERLDPSYPALVVFPEDVGILTVFSGWGVDISGAGSLKDAVERVVRQNLPAISLQRVRHGVGWVRGIFLLRQEAMARLYVDVFSRAAAKYGVYLVAGSIPLPDYVSGIGEGNLKPAGPEVYNVSYFFGPDGKVIGRQKKVNLIEMEGAAGLDLVPGTLEELDVFDTPLGRVGIAICLDAFKEDVLRRLQEKGAEILVQPSANPAAWSAEQQEEWLDSSWKAVASQQQFAYAVNPMMTGQVLDLGFFGQSSIIAREAGDAGKGYAATGGRKGFLSVAGRADSEEIVIARVTHPAALKAPATR